MVGRRTQRFMSEAWSGVWGADARYYARRSDGACFAIDGAVRVVDLAGSSPPSPHVRAVASLPQRGRYTLRVFAARPIDEGSPNATDDAVTPPRLFACGVRRVS